MSTTVTASFEQTRWTEDDAETAPEGALRHTITDYAVSYNGDGNGAGITGSSTINEVMVYRSETSVPFVGFEFFKGEIDGRTGSVVFQHIGLFDETGANADVTVVPDTGTDDLEGLSGSGTMHATTQGENSLTLEID